MEWISIKDKLPEFEETVLLYWKWNSTDKKDPKEYESYETGYLTEVTTRKTKDGIINFPEFHIGDSYDNNNPTHWAKLHPTNLNPNK